MHFTKSQNHPFFPSLRRKDQNKHAWEYIVDDFLEIRCGLDEPARRFLVERLQMEGLHVDQIDLVSAFTIQRKLVCVLNHNAIRECWYYLPGNKKLRIHRFKG